MGSTRHFQPATFLTPAIASLPLSPAPTPSESSLPSSPFLCSTARPPKVPCTSCQGRVPASKQQHWSTVLGLGIAVLISLLHTAAASPVFVDNPSLAQFQSGRNIRHLPCIVRKSGRSGVCMFAIDCIKQNGTHLGTCIDRFYFGSCCQMKDETLYAQEISDNSIDQNTISHFAHESTTLPTSALFKITTETQLPVHHSSTTISSSSVSVNLKNVTQSYTSTKVVSAATPQTTNTSAKPVKTTPSKRPPVHTTHKTSQFVVRTTGRPSSNFKSTVAPTTIKPPRRKTTITRPMLTTERTTKAPQVEQRVDSTSQQPTKFFTFQIVETTTPTPTEATIIDDTQPPTRRPSPTTGNLLTNPKSTTTTTTTPKITNKTKPQVTKRPATTKKPPPPTKRPASKPTWRPLSTTTAASSQPSHANGTSTVISPSSTVRKPPIINGTANIEFNNSTTPTQTKKPTTHAPRPKPKPTAEIVKVPKPTRGNTATTTAPAPTTAATKITRKPTTHVAPHTTSTTTEASSTTTTKQTTTTTHSTTRTTTATPILSTTLHPSTILTTTTTLTTESGNLETPFTTSTLTPGLVTWTNADAEPGANGTSNEEWQPRPPPPDWVPVPTIAPTNGNKTTVVATVTASTTDALAMNSTEKIIVSISSSVSEVMNNSSSTQINPDQKPNFTTVDTDMTTADATTTTTNSKPTISAASTSITTTEPPTILDSSTNAELTTESFLVSGSGSGTGTGTGTGTGLGSTTTEYSTEDYNSTAGTTTAAPANSLEGVDYRQVCGRRMFPEPRIVGGSNAAFGRWPWQISLRQWRTSTYLHKCGAALLNENWAITAAHCVDNVPPSDLLLRLGEYDLAEEEEPYGYQERRVQIVASHPQFDPRTFEYDLALLRFYEPVVFQPNIIPVCVPDSDQNFIGQTAFVTGWGRLYEDGPLPSVLQEVAVPVINNTICETMYRTAGYIEHIPHIFICAGWKKGGYDSCEGDSGGPMVLQREDDKRFQLGGVISWGIGCAEANQPGVYTRISEFRDWINQILQF